MGYSTSSDSEDEDDFKSRKKQKKQLKKLKRKKEKKQKKKSKRHKQMSTSESSSSGSEAEAEWVEKSSPASTVSKERNIVPVQSSQDESQSLINSREAEGAAWSNFESFIPTYSNSAREKRQTKKEWDAVRSASKPGQHSRELNPYWKDGGDGLPSEEHVQNSKSAEQSAPAIGDGGLHWLRKAYLRAKEQAKEEGRSLEDVAAERWGSMSKFYEMLEAAEGKSKSKEKQSSRSRYDEDRNSRKSSFRKPRRGSANSDDSDEKKYKEDSRSRDSSFSRRNESSQRQPAWMKPSSSSGSGGRQADDRLQPAASSKVTHQSVSTGLEHNSPGERGRSPTETEPEKPIPQVLTDQEMNALSAKIIKAEMLGNQELVAKLKSEHAEAEANRQAFIKGGGDTQASTDPSKKVVTKIVMDSQSGGRRRDKPGETHQSGQRVRYFPDDDKQTLQNMFQREKSNTVENENALFSRLAGKGMKSKPTDDYDLDDIFADKASSVKKAEKEKEREVHRVINEEKFYKKKVDDCPWCFDGRKLEKHIVASMANKSYLCLPPFQSLTDGHCLIVPMFHVSSATELDEDVWEEMQNFRHALVRMFKEDDQDLVIFETAMSLQRHPHMYLECVPIPKETGDVAPIYFKKAIQECESEWAQNKKLVELKDRGVRKAIPKGLPYFSVDFGDDSGFAHVIEDEKNFPRNFAQEIIGGMMELDHTIWRKRKNDNFKEQREKVMKFLTSWAPFDWTRDS